MSNIIIVCNFVIFIIFGLGCDIIKDEIKEKISDKAINEYGCEDEAFFHKWQSDNNSNVQTDGLIAQYLFSGNADDTSGNPNHGTVIGAELTVDRYGYENKAYYFKDAKGDSLKDIIIIKNNKIFNIDNLTISVWINGNHPQGFARIVDMMRYEKKEGFNLIVNQPGGGQFEFHYFNLQGHDCYGVSTISKLQNDQWQHIAVIYDSDTLKIFYNGILEETNTYACKRIMPTARYLSIGNGCDDNMYWPFKGSIDDVRIYNRALTEKEVLELYKDSK